MVPLIPVALAVFVLGSLFKLAFIYHVLYVLLAVAALARLWAAHVAGRLRVERDLPERALFGETLRTRVRVTNGGWLPAPWLRLRDRVPVALAAPVRFERAISLGPGATAAFEQELHARQRGWYEIGPVTIETGDVLGLNVHRRDFVTERRLLVYPKILPISAFGLPSRTPFGDIRTRQPLYEDPSRVAGLRDYQSGDSLRKVHWSASAATGRLQVKQLEPAMTLHTVVALDLALGSYDRSSGHYATELAIVVAASLVKRLTDQRQEIGLLSNGLDPLGSGDRRLYLPPRKGVGQATRLLDALARVQAQEGDGIAPLLRRTVGDLAWGSTLVVVAGEETADLRRELMRLRRSGFALSAVLITQRTAYRVDDGAVPLPGVPIYRVWRESEIDQDEGGGVKRRAARFASA